MSVRNVFFLFGLVLMMGAIFSCAEEKENNFLLNGTDILASVKEPVESSHLLSVQIGDTLTVTKVDGLELKNIRWDVDGDGKWDDAFSNKTRFSTILRKVGKRKISLTADGMDKDITKWVEVLEVVKAKIDLEDPMMPSFSFTNPSQKFNVSNKKKFKFEAILENIFEDDELILVLNGKEIDFDLEDETGVMTKDLKLKLGENKIELQATVDDELISEFVTIDYDPNGDEYIADEGYYVDTGTQDNGNTSNTGSTGSGVATGTNTQVVEVPVETIVEINPKPSVRFLSHEDKASTNNESQTVEIKTENIPNKNYLSIMLDGNEIKDFNFFPETQIARVNLKLVNGDNNITVIGQNDNGIVQSKLLLKYLSGGTTEDPNEIIDDPVVQVETPVKKVLEVGNSYASIGMNIWDFYGECAKKLNDAYVFYVTPKQALELSEFTVYTDNCGGLEIIVQSPTAVSRMRAAMVNGKNQVVLNDLDLILEPGVKYKVTCQPLSGYGNCTSGSKPKLLDIADCNKKSKKSSQLTANFTGKSVIYKLEYRY